jgi:hypothetical protein
VRRRKASSCWLVSTTLPYSAARASTKYAESSSSTTSKTASRRHRVGPGAGAVLAPRRQGRELEAGGVAGSQSRGPPGRGVQPPPPLNRLAVAQTGCEAFAAMTAAHHCRPLRSRFSAPHGQGSSPSNAGLSRPSEWANSQMMDSKENGSTTMLNNQRLDINGQHS